MRISVVVLLLVLALGGCSDHSHAAKAMFEPAAARRTPETALAGDASDPTRYMAYEHNVGLDVDEGKVGALHETARKACLNATAEQCVILQSSLETGRNAHAELRLRMKAAGIDKVIAALSAEGEIVRRSVNAEDLAAPIEDAAKKLEMLKDYRTRLEGLRGRAGSDIESLIKVNEQLAQVQSNIEAMTGEHARLMQRVDTELLNITISSLNARSFWGPISLALSDFGTHLSEGISSAITTMAYLLPWTLVFGLFGWALGKLWLRRRRSGPGV